MEKVYFSSLSRYEKDYVLNVFKKAKALGSNKYGMQSPYSFDAWTWDFWKVKTFLEQHGYKVSISVVRHWQSCTIRKAK